MIYVLCYNHGHYRAFCMENDISVINTKDFRFLESADMLRGTIMPCIVTFGPFQSRSDYPEISRVLMSRGCIQLEIKK